MVNDFPFWLPGVAVLAACAATPSPVPVTRAPAPPMTAVSLDGLADGIKHYRNRHGAVYAKYAPEQIVEIAENLLLYQRANGGCRSRIRIRRASWTRRSVRGPSPTRPSPRSASTTATSSRRSSNLAAVCPRDA